MNGKILNKISDNITGEILTSESLKKHTTYQVGGEAEILVCPGSSDEAAWVYSYACSEKIPVTVLGWGSNVIAPDEGIEGIVLKMRNPSAKIRILDDNRIYVDAGVNLIDLSRITARKGLSGLEPVAGIPGTVGGAVMMNAGTDDGNMEGVVTKVDVLAPGGTRYEFANRDAAFGYRKSVFQGSDWLILGAELQLNSGDPGMLEKKVDAILRERMRKFPLEEKNAGSVFKRPSNDYAGRLIEETGSKGFRIGGAAVSERHANFIINLDNATADDILRLIAELRRRVYEMFSIYLELEQIPLAWKKHK